MPIANLNFTRPLKVILLKIRKLPKPPILPSQYFYYMGGGGPMHACIHDGDRCVTSDFYSPKTPIGYNDINIR